MDPSKLHLKRRELSQIRKAARLLRDPGTTPSSSSSRMIPNKEKGVFLYNWKTNAPLPPPPPPPAVPRIAPQDAQSPSPSSSSSSSSSSADANGSGTHGNSNLSNARNAVYYCNPSNHIENHRPSSSADFRRRDTNLVPLRTPPSSVKAAARPKRRSKKLDVHPMNPAFGRNPAHASRYLRSGHPPSSSVLDSSVNQSDEGDDDEDEDGDSGENSHSEDFRRISGASPLLLKVKRNKWSHSSSKILGSIRRDDSSYTYSTPALSTSSYYRQGNWNPSTFRSWDGTATSANDMDDEEDDPLDLPGGQGCGIPCYWSSKRTPKHRGMCGSCYSPSLSDTIRRKGSSILCGSQSVYSGRHRSSSGTKKRRVASKSARGILPLLTNSVDARGGSSVGTGRSDDELSTNFGELDLEALSRFDGMRWSNCRDQDAQEVGALAGRREDDIAPENIRSLSQKYKPIFFNEIIGQNIVVQSLVNAVSRGRIAPVYFFQGPRGTGKTSAARVFAAALNCQASQETKPCGRCKECSDFISGKSRNLCEVDGTNRKGIDKVRYLLKHLSIHPPAPSASLQQKVFIVDECHLLPSKAWLAFLKFVEEPTPQVVFIFVTTDLDNVPRSVQSRSQKYLFNKIKDSDIVARLHDISANENLDVESDALELIALNADGSLRDAETMLDQLSLLGKRITVSLVNELVGVVSDEKLLDLLELAMSSNTAETVKRARELMDSGADPLVLMSQLASLIMDIIAGTSKMADPEYSESFFVARTLNESELERLKHALKLLSEAEKQLRVSSERSTWFTATLLQLGSGPSPENSCPGSSVKQSSRTTEEDQSTTSRGCTSYRPKSDAQFATMESASPVSLLEEANVFLCHEGDLSSRIENHSCRTKASNSRHMNGRALTNSSIDVIRSTTFKITSLEKLNDIWTCCIEKCHSKTLRQLLQAHGKLISISEAEGILIVYVAFGDKGVKLRVERFLSSITNSIEMTLKRNVEVRLILLPDGEDLVKYDGPGDSPVLSQKGTAMGIQRDPKAFLDGYAGQASYEESLKMSLGRLNDLEGKLKGGILDAPKDSKLENGIEELSACTVEETNGMDKKRQEVPMQRIESIIREQRLETAWLQAADKGTPGSLSCSRPEKNQVLPQDGIYDQHQLESANPTEFSSQHWEDEINHELKLVKITEGRPLQKDQVNKSHYPMSPSLLHDSSFMGNLNKESLVYESASGNEGCGKLLCWNKSRPHRKGKLKRTMLQSRRNGRFSFFSACVKANSESRLRRPTDE